MSQRSIFYTGLVISCCLAIGQAWADDKKKDTTLNQLVVLGDSLSAGVQNFSQFDGNTAPFVGGVQHGYAALVAKQAGVNLTQRLFSYPGIPPALELTPNGIGRGSTPGLPVNFGVQATNLSVLGFSVADVLSHPFPGDPTSAIDAVSDYLFAGNVVMRCGPILTGAGPSPPSV